MRIGIIGAGQLGLMLGEAAEALGMECVFVDPSETPPATSTGRVIQAPFDNEAALAELGQSCDVITYEFENVPVEALEHIPGDTPLYPPPAALGVAQDRKNEKALFAELGIPVPANRSVDTLEELEAAIDELGMPAVVKTRRFGYDGKGQVVIREAADVQRAFDTLSPQPLIVEAFVPYDFEVSIIGARSPSGETTTWPLSRNEHRDGILRTARGPVDDDALYAMARDYMGRLLDHLDYVGVLTLELFVADGKLLANEIAPRVHNSGHWTIEGAETSQFANHLLAITAQPLGATALRGSPGMVNIIGDFPAAARDLDDERLFLHDYGKSPRPGRKLGHITVVAASEKERDELLTTLDKL